MLEKSIHLMTGIVKFFNAALLYFNQSVFGKTGKKIRLISKANLLANMGDGSKVYDDGKGRLEIAIREYDQAVLDVSASLIAGKYLLSVSLTSFCIRTTVGAETKGRRRITEMVGVVVLARRR
jgi:hypothetical protein